MDILSYKYKKRKLDTTPTDKAPTEITNKIKNHILDDSKFNIETDDHKIYFKGKVTNDKVEKLIEIIDKKNKTITTMKNNPMVLDVVPKPIHLHITSYGGDLLAGFRAIDAIKRSKIPIYTIVDGYAASAATLMSVAGVKRFMTPNSYMLIHQLSSVTFGKFWEIKDDFENCNMWMQNIYEIYEKNTKMNMEEIKTTLEHDIWWSARKCVEKGLVDDVYVNE
jgi:ATP-dependent protease ClpP protease subunit